MPVEAVRLVLREHDDLEVARVHDVGQGEVDQPVDAAERHRGLGAVGGQRHQPLALATGQHDRQDVLPARYERSCLERSGDRRHNARPGALGWIVMRVDVLSQGVPARDLRRRRRPRRRAGPGAACRRRRRRAGALLRWRSATSPAPRRTPTRRSSPTANARDPHARRRPRDGRRLRGRRRRALAHLVRQHGRPPRLAAARRPARRDRAQPGADAAVEGRAARRRVRRVELGRAHGVRRSGRA